MSEEFKEAYVCDNCSQRVSKRVLHSLTGKMICADCDAERYIEEVAEWNRGSPGYSRITVLIEVCISTS